MCHHCFQVPIGFIFKDLWLFLDNLWFYFPLSTVECVKSPKDRCFFLFLFQFYLFNIKKSKKKKSRGGLKSLLVVFLCFSSTGLLRLVFLIVNSASPRPRLTLSLHLCRTHCHAISLFQRYIHLIQDQGYLK